jgi:hypothetical protein
MTFLAMSRTDRHSTNGTTKSNSQQQPALLLSGKAADRTDPDTTSPTCRDLSESDFFGLPPEEELSGDERLHGKSCQQRLQSILAVRTLKESLSSPIETSQPQQAERLRKRKDKAVRFSSIVIRDYPITIGDNPSVSRGPPLCIEWEHQFEITLTVDAYEDGRSIRRSQSEMLMPLTARQDLVARAGFSRSEIALLVKPVNVARTQRRRTIETLHLADAQFVVEMVSKKIMNMMTLGVYTRKERDLLKSFGTSAAPNRTEKSNCRWTTWKSGSSRISQAMDKVEVDPSPLTIPHNSSSDDFLLSY